MSNLLHKTPCLLTVLLVFLSLVIVGSGSVYAQNLVFNGTFNIPVPEGGTGGGSTSTSNCIGAGGTINFWWKQRFRYQ